jgi:hypothetical protein
MAWNPISNTVPQYSKNAGGAAASGYYIKFYASGTTTPINMASASDGSGLLAKCQLDTLGYPINGSSDVFVPHIDQAYKLALYENATDADNNALGSAAWVVDGLILSDSGLRDALIASNGTALITHTEYGSDYNLDTYLENQQVGNIKTLGCVGDNVTDDYAAFQSAISHCIANDLVLYIPKGSYYLSNRLTLSSRLNIKCDPLALIRWDSTNSANVGILLDFENPADQLCEIELPCLYGPAIDSSFSLPGYGSGGQDGSTRIGFGVEVRGGNRANVKAHIINGFSAAFYPKSTASSTCDNVNLTVNTSDFCERFVLLDSSAGFGLAQVVVKANTVWAKRIVAINSSAGYVNGCQVDIEGTAFVNEIGGCGIYCAGTGLRSSSFYINQIQAGKRDDSPNDTPVTIIPTGTMSASPVEGETITQSGSGATGVVVTNANYTLGADKFFTLQEVTGTFDTSNQLTGSVSGALGVNSVPSAVRGLVCPWVGGDRSYNTAFYDVNQDGSIGYFGGKHCDITIGAPFNHPTGSTDGAFSVFPQEGESVRIRDNGLHNRVKINHAFAAGSDESVAIPLSNVVGENNYNNGIGSASYADYVYCSITATNLAAGATDDYFLYHAKIPDNLTLYPIEVIPKNEGIQNNDLDIVAYANSGTNNRQVNVKLKNNGTSSYTGTVFFWVKINS